MGPFSPTPSVPNCWLGASEGERHVSSKLTQLAVRIHTFRVERGAAMVEYALLVALIAVVAIIALNSIGNNVSENFSDISSTMDAA